MTKQHRMENGEPAQPAPGLPTLRSRALAKYIETQALAPENHEEMSAAEVQKTLRELRIHQIELEMQNEQLRQSQLALEQSRARFWDLYNHAPVGYCLIGSDGQIQDANSTLGELLGRTPNYLNSQRIYSLIDDSDQDIFYLLRRRILATQQPDTCELRMRRSIGGSPWMQLSATAASVDGDANCLRVSLLNIDARVRAEAAKTLLENQLRESQKMEAVGTLAGGIAHDFNNILAVILVNAEVAICSADQRVVPCVEEIQKAAVRARELVRQILAFCRHQPTDRHTIALADVIQETIALLRSTMPARFDLKFTCEPEVPKVFADSTQIEQVMINLATNAMQALEGKSGQLSIHLDTVSRDTESKSQIRLQSEEWQDCDQVVRIKFTDDGPGMEPNVAARIFEPFFTTKPVNQGTGLGLAVVHGIVRAHHGEIFVRTKPGQGTTFTIYLPPAKQTGAGSSDSLVVDSPISDQTSVANRDSQRLTDCHVVYVDDDQWVLKSIVRLLTEHGVSVNGYTAPTAALQALRESPNDIKILVTDYNMPGLSGLEFAKQVHQLRPSLPVVITSGFIDEELRTHARDAGVTALMEKPFSSKRFLELLIQINQARDGRPIVEQLSSTVLPENRSR